MVSLAQTGAMPGVALPGGAVPAFYPWTLSSRWTSNTMDVQVIKLLFVAGRWTMLDMNPVFPWFVWMLLAFLMILIMIDCEPQRHTEKKD